MSKKLSKPFAYAKKGSIFAAAKAQVHGKDAIKKARL
jgi:hypothetical protein